MSTKTKKEKETIEKTAQTEKSKAKPFFTTLIESLNMQTDQLVALNDYLYALNVNIIELNTNFKDAVKQLFEKVLKMRTV